MHSRIWESATAEVEPSSRSGVLLGGRQERHHRQGESGERDARQGTACRAGAGQGADGVDST